jgi:hypothetical protein
MFAPPVAKPKSKAAAPKGSTIAAQQPRKDAVGLAYLLQRSIGIQAMLHLLAQRGPGFLKRRDPQQEMAGLRAQKAARGVSWDFSKIPLLPPERMGGFQPPSPFPAPRLSGPIQAKLKVGAVNDPLEHEADRVADQVMRMPAPDAFIAAAPLQLSRKCAACEDEEKLQKKPAAPQADDDEAPAIVHEVLRSPGQPLDASIRAYFEPRFGHDFSRVRVHTGTAAEQSARDVDAHAYTIGQDVVFGAGQYAPTTIGGRKLLAHELTHAVQQSSTGIQSSAVTAIGHPSNAAEQEAENAANAISSYRNATVQLHRAPPIARLPACTAAAVCSGGPVVGSAQDAGVTLKTMPPPTLIQAKKTSEDSRSADAYRAVFPSRQNLHPILQLQTTIANRQVQRLLTRVAGAPSWRASGCADRNMVRLPVNSTTSGNHRKPV